ncbi:hypothetical protein [Streptomyces sp. NPDC003737]|uniref:hypothetical protein n=1 Tax=Streptomyces sp. NPDC003737 TaxID=3364685 RepID=UPI0036986EED
MRLRSFSAVGVVAAAAALVALAASPAAAIDATSSCTTPDGGAWGSWGGNWASSTSIKDLWLDAQDEEPDGRHPEVRLVTYTNSGVRVNWPWHAATGGSGDYQVWHTSASDSRGILIARVEVANFDRDSLMSSCLSASRNNY